MDAFADVEDSGLDDDGRAAFAGETTMTAVWDAGYIIVLSLGLLFWAKGTMRSRLSV